MAPSGRHPGGLRAPSVTSPIQTVRQLSCVRSSPKRWTVLHYSSIDVDRPQWLGGGQWMLRDLRDITVVFGRNGSGKSLLLRNLAESRRYPVAHYASPERGGDIAYQQALSEQELNPDSRGNSRKGKNFVAQYRPEAVSRLGTLMTKLGHAAGRGSLGESKARTAFEVMEASVMELLPGFIFRIKDTPPFFEMERLDPVTGDATAANPAQLSSGESEILTLALDLLTVCQIWEIEDHPQRLLLLDEPDPHLHPELQVRFARFLSDIARRFGLQMIIATHSTTLLAAVGHLDDVSVAVVYLNNANYEQPARQAGATMRRLSALLGGHALIGPLFAAPLLLVEGDDDYAVWSHVPRHPGYRNLLAVVPAGGDEIFEHQKILEEIFGAIREGDGTAAGYVLLDGDKALPTHLQTSHVRFIKLDCHEIENLYLTDAVLAQFSLTWSDAKERIKAKADEFGEKADALRSLADAEDRRHVDLKGLMVPLVQIFDEKEVPWTVRLGKVLGQSRPTGDMADYLGPDVVGALWPPNR